MTPQQFINSIYLGDRSVTSISVDLLSEEVKIQIDCISRVRGDAWNFYDAEDLVQGYIVLEGVQSFGITPFGALPNDYVVDFEVQSLSVDLHEFKLTASLTDETGKYFPVTIVVRAKAVALEPYGKSQARIRV